jgi:hypothetical protein
MTNQGAPLFAVTASSSRWVVDERKSIGQEAPENPGNCQGAARGLARGGGAGGWFPSPGPHMYVYVRHGPWLPATRYLQLL